MSNHGGQRTTGRRWLLVIAGVAFVGAMLAISGIWYIPGWMYSLRTSGGAQARAALQSGLLTAAAALLAVAGALIALDETRQANSETRRANEASDARERKADANTHVRELYVRAIDQLGSENGTVRLGGIYALERIATDSPPDQRTIVEVLSAFIRTRSNSPDLDPSEPPVLGAADIRSAFQVLARLNDVDDVPRCDLAEAELFRAASLSGLTLTGAHLADASLVGADLSGAGMDGADLSDATMRQADLVGVSLNGANLARANLDGVNLTSAQLKGANLAGASLRGATLVGAIMEGANLRDAICRGANLTNTNMREVNLTNTHLEDANLNNAWLSGAILADTWVANADFARTVVRGLDLRRVHDLSQEQLDVALGDEHTQVEPSEMPLSWRSPKESGELDLPAPAPRRSS